MVDLGDTLAAGGSVHEARMAYAIALRFAQDCPALDREAILSRREAARAQAALGE